MLLAALLVSCALLPTGGHAAIGCSDTGSSGTDRCAQPGGLEEFLLPAEELGSGEYRSDVHVLWPTHVEVVRLSSDNGGWEPPAFSQSLATEAVQGWRAFKQKVLPSLPQDHYISVMLQARPRDVNEAFYLWQRDLSRRRSGENDETSSWPEMIARSEYSKLRKLVDSLGRRYLERSGLDPNALQELNRSTFMWTSVLGPGEVYQPRVRTGELLVGVFYAQVGSLAGKLRLADPRGHSAPFGGGWLHTPAAGDLIFFPSWLGHSETVSSPRPQQAATAETLSDGLGPSNVPAPGREQEEDKMLRVAFYFSVTAAQGSARASSDPMANIRFRRIDAIDPVKLGLVD